MRGNGLDDDDSVSTSGATIYCCYPVLPLGCRAPAQEHASRAATDAPEAAAPSKAAARRERAAPAGDALAAPAMACELCGAMFSPGRPRGAKPQKFCSVRCRRRASEARRRTAEPVVEIVEPEPEPAASRSAPLPDQIDRPMRVPLESETERATRNLLAVPPLPWELEDQP
jgi:hypothetical protein